MRTAKWATRHRSPSRHCLLILPFCMLVLTFIFATWKSSAARFVGLESLWAAQGARARHSLHKDQGLLYLNASANARHPIAELISLSERRWAEKLAQQSTTLRAAVEEYQRRYKRLPPLGFDKWWDWCKQHNVQLLDEYDQLHADLEMFWAMSPKEMLETQRGWETHEDTFTIGKDKQGDDLRLVTYNLTDANLDKSGKTRAGLQMKVLDDVKQHLPPFHATWTAHDASKLFVSWELREQGRKAVEARRYIDFSQAKDMPSLWSSACPPSSPIRTTFDAKKRYHTAEEFLHAPKSFIADFRASMDPCHNPELTHISTLSDYPEGPQPRKAFIPAFARAKTLLHADILGIPTEDAMQETPDEVPFREKTDKRVLWRGRTTGIDMTIDKAWNMSHRLRFVQLANRQDGHAWVIPPPNDVKDRVSPARKWALQDLNQWFFDVAFVEVLQCPEVVCKQIEQEYTLKEIMYPEEGKHYKYIVDLDGNGWSSRFRRLMDRNVLVFKSTIYPEWWTDRAAPWVHFVPVKLDYGDLYDIMAFFRGLPDGTPGHEDLAERIAMAGRDWVDKFWRKEDVTAYTWRMYLEYIRLMSDDRSKMDFVLR